MIEFPGYENIKLCYSWGCYSKVDLGDYVKMGSITKDQYKELCGEDFPETVVENPTESPVTDQPTTTESTQPAQA